jgi:hypothetical protein
LARLPIIVCVVADGTPPGSEPPGVPQNPRVTVSLVQKTSLLIPIQVVLASGPKVPIDGDKDEYTLVVRKTPGAWPAIKKVGVKAAADQGVGRVDFQLDPRDSLPQRMCAGRYVFEIQRAHTETVDSVDVVSIDAVLPLSGFLVEPNAGA